MQNPVTPADARALMNAAYKTGIALGRKFEKGDLTVALRNAALEYALWYQGDFQFMKEMSFAASQGNGLYDGQSAAVLNCLMADAKRRLASRAPRATSEAASQVAAHQYLTSVPDGRYRVTLVDGEHLAVRFETAGKDSKLAGSRIISTRIGEDWMGRGHIAQDGSLHIWRATQGDLRSRVENAVEILDSAEAKDGWLIAGLAFAQAGSQCFFCGRDLDTPESLLVGYGPTCADKHGLPWGDKATPAAVLLARAEAEKAGEVASPAPEAEATVQAASTEVKEVPITQKSNHRTSPVSLAEAHARGKARSYSEIFGDES